MGGVGGRREIGGSDIIIFFILKRLLIKFRVCLKKKLPSSIHSNAQPILCMGLRGQDIRASSSLRQENTWAPWQRKGKSLSRKVARRGNCEECWVQRGLLCYGSQARAETVSEDPIALLLGASSAQFTRTPGWRDTPRAIGSQCSLHEAHTAVNRAVFFQVSPALLPRRSLHPFAMLTAPNAAECNRRQSKSAPFWLWRKLTRRRACQVRSNENTDRFLSGESFKHQDPS